MESNFTLDISFCDLIKKSLKIKQKKYIIISKQLYQIIKVNNFFVSFVNDIFEFFNMGKWILYELNLDGFKIVLVKIEHNTIKNYFNNI